MKRKKRKGDGMGKGVVQDKSFAFALRIVKLARFLRAEKREFVLSRQVLRSGTAIGALVREAEHAESRADFAHKMNIALKEANETAYWLDLLHGSDTLTGASFASLRADSEELIKLLVAIVQSSKSVADPAVCVWTAYSSNENHGLVKRNSRGYLLGSSECGTDRLARTKQRRRRCRHHGVSPSGNRLVVFPSGPSNLPLRALSAR